MRKLHLNVSIDIAVPDNMSDEIFDTMQNVLFEAKPSLNVTSSVDEEEVVFEKTNNNLTFLKMSDGTKIVDQTGL